MRIIAVEEQYKIPALAQANKNHPVEAVYTQWQQVGRYMGDPSQGIPPGIYDLGEKRIAAMDAAGIDVQILSHTVPGPEELEPKLARDLAKQANDAANAAVAQYPGRFRAFATSPMRDPKGGTRVACTLPSSSASSASQRNLFIAVLGAFMTARFRVIVQRCRKN